MEMERYRIGDFARELGVTPDFLKYCERKGVLTPQTEENGYRYYAFTQSAILLEYIKFKNQGYSAEEIRDALHASSFAGALSMMREKEKEIAGHMRFEQALLDYYRDTLDIACNFGEEPVWQVRRCEDFYFLPHTVEHHFLGDDAIRERVKEWNAYMPVVQSTYRITRDAQGELSFSRGQNVWGFSLGARAAQALGVCTDAPVERVCAGRCIEVFSAQRMDGSERKDHRVVHEVMKKNGFTLRKDVYSKVLFKIWENGVRWEYSVLYAPIED